MDWQRKTKDPWLCAPSGVLEPFEGDKNNLQCMNLDNFNL